MERLILPLVDLTRQFRNLKTPLLSAVKRVCVSGRFILGPEVARFEKEFARFCGARYGVGVASGTDALELALRASGVGPRDYVVTVSLSFLSTVDAIRRVGATAVFVDVDPHTYTLDPEDLLRRLRRMGRGQRRRIRAILPVHLYGNPCPMDGIVRMAKESGWWVIEDCAQAHGARWRGRPVGSFGDLGCFSFYPTKNLGAYGDAGMVVTHSPRLYERLRALRFQGRRQGGQQILQGLNTRLDELQAAILRVKFRRLNRWIHQRRKLAEWYTQRLGDLAGIQLPTEDPRARHAYHLYSIQTSQRSALRAFLAHHGIATGVYYPVPIHRQPLNRGSVDSLPVTERLTRRILSLPLFPEMKREEVDRICRVVRRFYERASRAA